MHPVFKRTSSFCEPTRAIGHVCALDELTVLSFNGADTKSFLQGQLTNDVAKLPESHALLAGYCTAQGRLLATMVLSHGASNSTAAMPGSELLGLLRTDLATAVTKRLSMFVLRAKVKISLSAWTCAGVTLSTPDAATLTQLNDLAGGVLPTKPYDVLHAVTGIWIAAPKAEASPLRWWWLAENCEPSVLQSATPSKVHNEGQLDAPKADLVETLKRALAQGSANRWAQDDLEASLPWLEAKTQDLFIPQTLNLDLIEGVSFTKGCYPGQEIVARSHYRGILKRRMAFGRIPAQGEITISAGDDIITMNENQEACGRVINAVSNGPFICFLFEAPFSAIDDGAIAVASAPTVQIEQLKLPYTVTRPGNTN
jgi:folate-binding protein YgfZ